MSLAGIALIRSVDTSNLIAGNLAFRQGATIAGDWGLETARTWLLNQATNTPTNLNSSSPNVSARQVQTTLNANKFSTSLPPYSVMHFVLKP